MCPQTKVTLEHCGIRSQGNGTIPQANLKWLWYSRGPSSFLCLGCSYLMIFTSLRCIFKLDKIKSQTKMSRAKESIFTLNFFIDVQITRCLPIYMWQSLSLTFEILLFLFLLFTLWPFLLMAHSSNLVKNKNLCRMWSR